MMRSIPTLLVTAALVTAALAAPSAASAYYVEARGTAGAEVPVRWADGDDTTAATVDVTYRINVSSLPSGVDAAPIEAAFASWTAADCATLTFARGDDSTEATVSPWTAGGYAPHILVYFTDSNAEWTGGPAVGHFYFAHDGTGVLIGGTVVLNSRDHTWATDGSSDAIDVQGTVTALIGRAIGITSSMEGNATYPRYAPGDTAKRTLGSDDVAAVQFLYASDDTSCVAPADPEAECDGIMNIGEEPCPPPVTTNPGDGGTAMPGTDAGMTTSMPDAGTASGTDAGTGGMDDGGCSVGAVGATRGGAWLLGLLGLVALRRRRRG